MFICDLCGKQIPEKDNYVLWVEERATETKYDVCKQCFTEWMEIKNEKLIVFIEMKKGNKP